MSWLDDIIAKVVRVNGVEAVGRRALNLVAGPNISLTATDDETNGQTTVTVTAGSGLGTVVNQSMNGLAPLIPMSPPVGAQLYVNGSYAPVWGLPPQPQMVILGARAPHMTGWQLDEADGCYVQSSASTAGEIVFPLSMSDARALVSLSLIIYRISGTGTQADTRTGIHLERRWSATGAAAPGAWSEVTATLTDTNISTWPSRILTLTPETPHLPDATYSYRVRITGESGSNAQPVKIIDMKASVQ